MNANSRPLVLKASLYLWMAVFPFSMAMSNLMLVICSVLVLLHLIHQPSKSLKLLLGFPAMIMFLLFAISVIWSDDVMQGLYELKHNIPLVLSTFVLFFCIQWIPTEVKKSLIVLIIATFLAFIGSSIFNLLPFETARNIHGLFGNLLKPFEESNHDLFGWYIPFMFRIFFGNLMCYLAIFSAVKATIQKNYLWWLSAFFLSIMVTVIGVRASMLGLIFSGIFLLAYIIKEKVNIISNPIKKLAFIILFIPIVLFALNKVNARWKQTNFEIETLRNGTFKDYEFEHFSVLTRLVSWENGYQLWKKNPMIGTGIGDYKKEYSFEYQDDNLKVPLYYHSQWLYFLGVFGVIGLLIFVSSYIHWWIQFRNHKTMFLYGSMLSIYLAVIWIFDAGMLNQTDMMSFGIFTTLIMCFKEN